MIRPFVVAKRPGRVLVIEDDLPVLQLLERVLVLAGHTVTLCPTGTEGLAQFSQKKFDLVLIDKNLPDVDGIEVLRRIHQAQPALQTIVITAYPSAETKVLAGGLGAWAYLIKPFALVDLLDACDAAIEHSSPVSAATAAPRTSKRVLVIDDDPSVMELVRRVLTRAHYEVFCALTANAALDILREHPVDLLLVDRNLPTVNGFEVILQARAIRPGVAAVMMTAAGGADDAKQVELQGFILKPFAHVRQLVEVVGHALEGVGPN